VAITTTIPDALVEQPEGTAPPNPGQRSDGPRMASRNRRNKEAPRQNGPTGKRTGSRRKASRSAHVEGATRYFLTKPGTNGVPELECEVEDENQAMIEALKSDRTFALVTEWRPKADCSVRGRPVIEKEPVPHGA
jgi:hypothetical protein